MTSIHQAGRLHDVPNVHEVRLSVFRNQGREMNAANDELSS
jgi:hypothetical protein